MHNWDGRHAYALADLAAAHARKGVVAATKHLTEPNENETNRKADGRAAQKAA
jgi:hypothetical protein